MECCFLLDFSFVFLVLLPWSVSGTFTVIGPQQPITAFVDGEAIFTCQLSPQTDAQYMDVIWFYGQDGYVVHQYKYRQDYLKYQDKNYEGRTEFLRDGISKGSVALKLHHIRPSDEGKYRCFFESPYAYEEAEFQVFVAGKFTVTGPQQPIIALLGGEATFPCHLSPQMDAQNMNVMWFYGQFSNLVHQYTNRQDNLKHQHQEYKGRTEFLRDDISNGSVALKLHHIRPSDEGKYRCSFESPHVYEEAEFQVYVAGKGSVPHIHVENDGNEEFRLTCTSTGWYPEPKVWWRKNQEESLSKDAKIVKDENGLFSIKTSITASSDSTVNVSCFIWNHLLNQKLEANVSLPDALSPNDPSWKVIVPVVLIIAVCIIFIVIWNLKKGKGMCKDESGIAKVERGVSKNATGVSKDATGMCKDESVESGMAESETDSLLQPSAESNVATSASKNATGASKDASGVNKDAIGVETEATGESEDTTVEKKETIGESYHPYFPNKCTRQNYVAVNISENDLTTVNQDATGVEIEAIGESEDTTVEKKETIGESHHPYFPNKCTRQNYVAVNISENDLTMVNQDATGVETEATGESEDTTVVNQDATGVEIEAIGESEDTTGNIQKEQRRMDPSSLCHHEVVQEEDQKKMEGNLSPSPDTLKMPDLQTAKKYRVDVPLDMDKALPFHLPQMDEENSHKNRHEGCERSEPLACMIGKERFASIRGYWEMQVKEQMQ